MINYSRQLISAHESGDANATYKLGFCYYYGIGVERDLDMSIEYYKMASEKGNEDAMIELANCYLRGIGVCKQPAKGLELLEKCAENGNAYACYLLGDFWFYGHDFDGFWSCETANKKAKKYYKKSAMLGYTEAEYMCGQELYEKSSGSDEKHELAKELLLSASMKDHKDAQYELGKLYRYEKGSEKKALYWLEKSANRGVRGAVHMIADMFRDGVGVEQDYAKAIEYYSYATSDFEQVEIDECYIKLKAQGKSPSGKTFMPTDFETPLDIEGMSAREIFEDGLWHEKLGNLELSRALISKARTLGYEGAYNKAGDIQQKGTQMLYVMTNNFLKKFAIDYYMGSAKKGDAYAQRMVAQLYEQCKEMENAEKWFEKSANNGDAVAMHKLGMFYENGLGTVKSKPKAVEWIEKSAICGYFWAQLHLSTLFDEGDGVEKDKVKAFEWMEKSANQGYSHACELLGQIYEHGVGVEKSKEKALEYYEKALDGFGHINAPTIKSAIQRVKT